MAVGASRTGTYLHICFGLYAVILFYRIGQTGAGQANVLYSEKDNVLILNKTNFAANVFHKDHALILEFYNSYCGHCIRYAPTWIAFAKDIKDWKKVVVPAVVDCADSANQQICQDHNVPAFPTVKHFWTDLSAGSRGEDVEHKDVDYVRHHLIDFLKKNALEKGSPDSWPMLQPSSSPSLNEIWQSLPTSITSFLLVVESQGSYVGSEIILDFSGTDARILKMETSNSDLYKDLTSQASIRKLPALVLLRRNFKPEPLWIASSKRRARAEFRTAIQVALHIPIDSEPTQETKPNVTVLPENRVSPGFQAQVQMVDLENALSNILRQEVALKKELSGDNLSTLKSFLAALTKCFPGRAPVMNFLQNLYRWLSEQKLAVDMDSMQRFITDSQSADSFLPPMTDWSGCKGTSPKYRGYSCGLWSLFHSMTVKAFYLSERGEMVNPQQVLFAIRNYIVQFFGCTECAEHFQSMSNLMEQETQHPNDTVIWLWHAHNRVNQRLKGDATEDPGYPKVQFPPVKLCATCRELSPTGSQRWSLPNVLQFMKRFYFENISRAGVVSFHNNPMHVTGEPESNKTSTSGWNFSYFSGLDISLCVLLYVFSMVLLVIVFLLFRLRRRRVKRKNVATP